MSRVIECSAPGRTIAATLIALAALSYRYWESPFLALKDRWFPHRIPRRPGSYRNDRMTGNPYRVSS